MSGESYTNEDFIKNMPTDPRPSHLMMKLAKSSLELPLPFGNSTTLFTVMTVLHN
jgi:hypothetical protein